MSLTGNVQVGSNSGFVTVDKPQFFSDPYLTIFYDFDSESYTGTTIANKGNGGAGFTATLQGTTAGMIDTTNPKFGSASLRNDYPISNNQGIKVNTSVPIATNITFSFWIRKKSTPPATTFDRIFEFSENATTQGVESNAIALDISSSGIILPVLTNGSASCFGTLSAPIISYNVCDDTWKNIIWVINGSSSIIYVNGSNTQRDNINTNPFTVSPTRTNALIGNSNYNVGTRDFSGNLDNFRYYNGKALNYAEIYQLYNNRFYTLDVCGGFLANGSSVIYEPVGSTAGANSGSLTLLHGDASGSSSIMFKSVNDSLEYGYIQYEENATGSTGYHFGLMTIGIENDSGLVGKYTDQADRLSFFPSGGQGFVGVNTKTPQYSLDVSGTLNTNADASMNGVSVGRGGGNLASNTVVGYQALKTNTTGTNNVAVGYQALTQNTSNNNTAVGYQALQINTNVNNTAVGFQSLFANASGSSNIAVGSYALYNNDTGINNTAIGYNAGYNTYVGSYNTYLGSCFE